MKLLYENGQEFSVFLKLRDPDTGEMTNRPIETFDQQWVLVGNAFVCHSDYDNGPLDDQDREIWQITHIATGYRFPVKFLRDKAVVCAMELWELTNWSKLDTLEKYTDFGRANQTELVKIVRRYAIKADKPKAEVSTNYKGW